MSTTARAPAIVPTGVRSLPFDLWPSADREAWAAACRPAQRLKRGGAGSHLKPITLSDLQRRYGYFLDHLDRSGLFDRHAAAADQVTPENVGNYVEELKGRVGSITTYGSIYKLRRAAQLLDSKRDFAWLVELEKDLALVMRPRSKADRLVLTEVLVEAGLILMQEADGSTSMPPIRKARQYRDGLMLAMLALHPIRLKNFVSLNIGGDLVDVDGRWWIRLSATETKEKRPDERSIDELVAPYLARYLDHYRPALARASTTSRTLWLSANSGQPMTYHAVAHAIEAATLMTTGVKVSAHLFRTAAASSAAVHAGHNPNLGSAVLHHRDRRITEQHYNRASNLSAADDFGEIVRLHVER